MTSPVSTGYPIVADRPQFGEFSPPLMNAFEIETAVFDPGNDVEHHIGVERREPLARELGVSDDATLPLR